MGHPQGSAEWATNPTFASPGDAWDGDPTKVDPPAGKTAEGWEPTEEPPAEFLNSWQNKVGLLTDYLRLIQPSNWTLERDISPTTPQRFLGLGYDPSTGVFIVTGDTAADATFLSRNGGETWTVPSTPPAAFAFARAIASDGAGNWVLCADNLNISESSDDGDTWTSRAMGGASTEGNDVKYDPTNSLWIVTGNHDTAGDDGRRIWTSPDRSAWTVRLTDSDAGGFVGKLWVSAAGWSVALSTTNVFYTSPDGTTWTVRTVTGASTLNDVVYSEGAGLWMITGTVGGVRTVWTSTDGITFTSPGVAPNFALGRVSCDQSELFILGGSIEDIYASTDRGVTWTQVAGFGAALPRGPHESGGTPTGFGEIKQHISFFAGRFMSATEAGNLWHTIAML